MALESYIQNVRVRYSIPWDQAQTMPGGATYEASQDAARAAMQYVRAVIRANHTRSGVLGKSLRTDVSKRGSRVVAGYMRSNVEHAEYFFYGTGDGGRGRIFPTHARALALRSHRGPITAIKTGKGGIAKVGPLIVSSVEGQQSNFRLLQEGAKIGVARVAAGSTIPTRVRT